MQLPHLNHMEYIQQSECLQRTFSYIVTTVEFFPNLILS